MRPTVDTRQLERLGNRLHRLAKKGVPHAMKNAVNKSAFAGRDAWQNKMRDEFVLRNRYTERSLRVEKARGLNPRHARGILGSTADYMADQEFGASITGGGKHGHPIPTSYSAGQMGAQPRTKLPRRPNALQRIKLSDRHKRGSRRQQVAATVAIAAKHNQRFVFLDLARTKGIFRLIGGKKKRLRMVHDLTHRTVRIRPTPTLGPMLREIEPRLVRIHEREVIAQLKFHKVW